MKANRLSRQSGGGDSSKFSLNSDTNLNEIEENFIEQDDKDSIILVKNVYSTMIKNEDEKSESNF